MSWNNYHRIYFIGIGGIGMSALARYFNTIGLPVSGYDRTPSPLIEELRGEDIPVHFEDRVENIPEEVREDNRYTLVVYTPAVPKDHAQLSWFRKHGYMILKRSEVLGMITEGHFTIAVAGTHGKTSTSAIIAFLLKEAGRSFTAFLGGISTDFNSNYVRHQGRGEEIIVVEADEYDRSFLKLFPDIAVVTSMDADHLDIYGSEEELRKGFEEFIKNIKGGGSLIVQERLDLSADARSLNRLTYGLNRGQFFASHISINDGFFNFDLYAENSKIRSLRLGVPGFHNIENALAALAAVTVAGEQLESSAKSLAQFSGVKRRFEFHLRSEDVVLVDDYAHHPEEIRSFVRSMRELFPEHELVIIFQPHLFTRTRDFAGDFGKALSGADKVLLLEIYPAREEPIPGIDAEMLFGLIDCEDKRIVSKEFLRDEYVPDAGSAVATVGAGDIDRLIEPMKRRWSHEMA